VSNNDSTPLHEKPAVLAAIGIPAVTVAYWVTSARTISAWALRNNYFTDDAPVIALPGAHPATAGPTLLTAAAVIALLIGVTAATMAAVRHFTGPVQHEPDDRRPLPPVAAPATAVAGITSGTITLACIPFVPQLIAAAAGIIVTVALADWVIEQLRERRERAREVNEIEWALYPYLGFDELPRRRIVSITEWDVATDDRPDKPKTIVLAYRGRREELKPELSRRLDDAAGSHYTLSYATTDQLITASLASVSTEPLVVRGLREQLSTTALFESAATLQDPQFSGSGDLIGFTVKHQIGAKIAGTDKLRIIENKISGLLNGRWHATSVNNLEGVVTFGIRPELPTKIYPPIIEAVTTVADACRGYTNARIPIGVDENGNRIEWFLKLQPHMLLMGPTGTGKTGTIHTLVAMAALFGIRIFIVDFKGGEFTSYRNYPGVVTLITEPYEAVAMVNILYKEMQGRYNLWKRNKNALNDKEPFLIIFDEYTEFQDSMKNFYSATKGKGAPRDCPTLTQFSSLLRLGRTCRFHCVAALQRADQKFLEGEAKDNFTMRVSLGKLSTQAAIMIHGNAYAGRTVPLGIRGRGTALNRAGQATEIQAYYTPDPAEPADAIETDVLASLRPPVALYERGLIMPPEVDPNNPDGEGEAPDFTGYQRLPLLKSDDYPQYDPASPNYSPPEWLQVEDRGVDSIFGRAPGHAYPATPTTSEQLVDMYEDEMGDTRTIGVVDLDIGDYVRNPNTGEWGIVDDEPVTADDSTTSLMLRNIHTGQREETSVDTNTALEVRDIAETHLAPA